jgi:hypothetical protein
MALSANVTQHGASYEFGFPGGDAAPVIAGFVARSAELRYEAEVFAQAQDGEGHTDSIVTSAGPMRKITATFTGYIESGFNVENIADSFPWDPTGAGGTGRLFITRNVSVPRRKGEFVEVSLEAESYGGIPIP